MENEKIKNLVEKLESVYNELETLKKQVIDIATEISEIEGRGE